MGCGWDSASTILCHRALARRVLATGLALEYPQRVEHAYLFDSPGLGGLTGRGALDQIAWVYHITGGSYDPTRFTSVRAKPGSSIISGLGIQASAPILIESEDRGVGAGNHSIETLGDALAIYDTLEPLALFNSKEVAGRIIRDASASPLGKLEGALDALRLWVLGPSLPATPQDNRESFYQNLYALEIRPSIRHSLATLL